MGMNNIELYNFFRKYIGTRGAEARNFCGLPSSAAWCCACVSWVFYRGGDSALFYGGKKVVYVPTAEKWCYANLANVPIYLAMPMDIITFDWNNNGVPDHIGFVRERKSDTEIYTIEGNTSGGIIACKTRPQKYISGCFRTQFKPTSYRTDKALVIDGVFGYTSIACLQKALKIKVDGILGKGTVKALQKKAGVAQDGSWGMKTSKAVQKMVGVKADGWFGEKSVKALQKWINKQLGYDKKPVKADPLQKWYDALKTQFEWSKNQRYEFDDNPTVANSKVMGTCITFPAVSLQRLGLLPKGGYFYLNPNSMQISGNCASYVKEHTELFVLGYPHKTVYELWKSGYLKKGDICGFGNPNYHTMVFMGMHKDGYPLWDTMGHFKGLNVRYRAYESHSIDMVVRLRKTLKEG